MHPLHPGPSTCPCHETTQCRRVARVDDSIVPDESHRSSPTAAATATTNDSTDAKWRRWRWRIHIIPSGSRIDWKWRCFLSRTRLWSRERFDGDEWRVVTALLIGLRTTRVTDRRLLRALSSSVGIAVCDLCATTPVSTSCSTDRRHSDGRRRVDA